MDIYKKAKELNIPIDHHESDLYLKQTAKSTQLLNEYEFKSNVRIFISQIDHTPWYDIPFAFTPFWESHKS